MNGPVVHTTSGTVVGRELDGGVRFFGGVPYAEAARFDTPRAPTPWIAPRDAADPGPLPPQVVGGFDIVPGMTAPRPMHEHCLTAEVWLPPRSANTAQRAPILVWVPGGSFLIGGASLPTYDGARLAAEHGLVVIGLNYRLGALGFLALEGVASNLGLRDLRAALDWVTVNAAAFGADPSRLTLIGESAGAGAIAHLLCDDLLPVSGAVMLSGSPGMTQSAERARAVAAAFLENCGFAADSDGARHALRVMPLDVLLDAQQRTVDAVRGWAGMLPFHPWIDADLLHESPVTAALAPVPLIVGTTAHEMELFRDAVPEMPRQYAVRYLTGKAAALGLSTEGVESLLSRCGDDLVTAIAEVDLVLPADALASRHRSRGFAAWRSSFTWEAPRVKACHALDLPFVFGTLDIDGWRDFAGAHNAAADALSRSMRASIGAFATAGVPSCDPIGVWPHHPAVIELGATISVRGAV